MAEYCQGEPFFVALTERIIGARASDAPSPEDAAAENEESGWRRPNEEEDDEVRAARAAERLAALVGDTLPIEEMYVLRRTLDGASQRQIAAETGIRQPSVQARLARAIAKVRAKASGEGRIARPAVSRMKIPGLTAYAAKR